jgi:MFS transporter, DHA3 family, macrolide efflux protein
MWRNRNVWILLLGEGIAGLGMWVGIIGNLEFLQQHVPSDFMKSLILFAGLFVGVLFGPYAGKVIDRSSKKTVMIVSSVARSMSVMFMFVAISTGQVWWMVMYMLGIGISAAFYFPALQAAIPLIAKEEELLTLNGWHMNIGTIARIVGTALGGILIIAIPLSTVYIITLGSFLFVALTSFLLQLPNDKNRSYKQEKQESFTVLWPLIKRNRPVFTGLVLMLVPIGFIGSFNLMVLKISEMLQDPAIKGWLYTTEGVMFMLGAFMIRRVAVKLPHLSLLIGAAFFISLAQMSLYFAEYHPMAIVSFGVFGFAAGSFFPIAATLFQKSVPKDYHGRFFSFRNMMDRILFQFVLVSSGFFLDTIGFQIMVLLFGVSSFFLTCIVLGKHVKKVDKNLPQTM